MPLPRVTRFYRAYSEFDKYSDVECLGLVVQARVRRGDAAWVVPLGLALSIGLVVGAFGYMASLVVLTAAGGGKAPVAGASATTSPVMTGGMGVPAGTGTLAAGAPANIDALTKVLMTGVFAVVIATVIVAFILIQREMLVRTMRKIIARALCPFCEFSLVGLIARSGRVCCPECGEEVVLSEHRISEDDLIPNTPEGLRAMREKWRTMGADSMGVYTGGKGEQVGPRGEHRSQWAVVNKPAKGGTRPAQQGGLPLKAKPVRPPTQ